MKLVIVESPTKATTINKFLGKGYKVESSFGHVRDLPKSRFAIDLENNFAPEYIIPIKVRKRVTELRAVAEKATEIILASDEDREGEAIAWHLNQVLRGVGSKTKKGSVSVVENKPVKRIVFHEITKPAIEAALKSPRELDENMVNAQQARRILDRVVGYKLSPFLWKKVAKGLSAGRVQSVALRLIMDREAEIKAFKPEEYWSISALLFESGNPTTKITSNLISINDEKLDKFAVNTEARAGEIVSELNSAEYEVASIEQKETKKNPPAPFTTSTLQQTASNQLRFSAKKTMMFAQRLYEKGLITYMRTDSLNLSAQSLSDAQSWLRANLGSEYALDKPRRFKSKSKGAQEAHEAVRPTSTVRPEDIVVKEEAERKLYDLIWRRFLASQMPEALFLATKMNVRATNGGSTFGLRSNGLVLKFDGFLRIYPTQFEEKTLPVLNEGTKMRLESVNSEQHFTEPPARYTEAKLIKTLEEFGIGRPSTYVPIIFVIQSRNYVSKEQGKFVPTEIGEMVSSLLTEHFPQIVDVGFTAKMEEKLDSVADGEIEWQSILSDFYGPFDKLLEIKYEEVEKLVMDEESKEVCDKCSKPMIIRFGRFGKFLACSGFPDCKNAKPIPGVSNGNEPRKIDMKCLKCEVGDVVERYARKTKKKFWGCSKYPECDWASWDDPLNPKEPKKAQSKDAESGTDKTK